MSQWDLFLSPHLDDVVLSVGGLVAQAGRLGRRARVITVCAGAPPRATRVVAARQEEDRRALSNLGAEQVLLPELDAIYRDPAYAAPGGLFGSIVPDDDLTARLCGHLRDLLAHAPDATCYLPLGIGDHVDHQLVHRAGPWLREQGLAVHYYEDLPYALHARPPIDHQLRPTIHDVTLDFPAKLRAAQAYRSQVPGLFGSDDAMFTRLIAYAVSLSPDGTRCYERTWST